MKVAPSNENNDNYRSISSSSIVSPQGFYKFLVDNFAHTYVWNITKTFTEATI